MSAFAAALAAGYGIELDVRLTSDGHPVVFHDDDLKRMCAHDGRIEDYKAADLHALHLARTNQSPPLLREVLDCVRGQQGLYIEIKNMCKPGALEEAVLKAVADYQGPFALASFNSETLAYFRKRAPHLMRGLIAAKGSTGKAFWANARAVWRARPHFVALDVRWLPCGLWAWARLAGRPVLTWTVRDDAGKNHAAKWADNMVFEGFCP